MKVVLVRLPDGTLTFRATLGGIVEEFPNRGMAISRCCKKFSLMRKAGAA